MMERKAVYDCSEAGFVRKWLILGPFPNPQCKGFFVDYLGGEEGIVPDEGISHLSDSSHSGKVSWMLADTGDYLDLRSLLSPNENVVAYAFSYLLCERDSIAVIGVGSDDGVRIWINGTLVHDKHVHRGARPDADTIVVGLREGLNRCLVKVEQGEGDWGLFFRIKGVYPRGDGARPEILGKRSSGYFRGGSRKPKQFVEVDLLNSGLDPGTFSISLGGFPGISVGVEERIEAGELKAVRVPIPDMDLIPDSDGFSLSISASCGPSSASDSIYIPMRARRDLSWPRIDRFDVVLCDFHCHTTHSDGALSPQERVFEAFEDGIDLLAITDHNTSSGFQEASDVANGSVMVIPGIEVSTRNYSEGGHFVLIGPAMEGMRKPDIREDRELLDWIRACKELGAISILAHPLPAMTPIVSEMMEEGLIDGIEVENQSCRGDWESRQMYGSWFYPQAMGWARGRRISILACTDAHVLARTQGSQRSCTLVLSRDRSWEGVRDAILEGRAVGWFDGMLWGPKELLDLIWSGSVRFQTKYEISPSFKGKELVFENLSPFPFRVSISECSVPWVRFPDREMIIWPKGKSFIGFDLLARVPGTHQISLKLVVSNMFWDIDENPAYRIGMTLKVS
jgi:hypothetical protein